MRTLCTFLHVNSQDITKNNYIIVDFMNLISTKRLFYIQPNGILKIINMNITKNIFTTLFNHENDLSTTGITYLFF